VSQAQIATAQSWRARESKAGRSVTALRNQGHQAAFLKLWRS
jgi:hypothetical protein